MVQTGILANIRRLRKARGFSQTDMAEALHIALKTYQNIEGGVTRIDIDRLGQIAQVLDVGLPKLLTDEETADMDVAKFISEEKALYHKIIHDKEAYIAQLEDSIRFYQEMLREHRVI
ncbi:helix-turn-helix transcriptional regulator [Parapedobacter sp. ISTM3]|uniref:Helix-turn-helix n=1 Tax=Parapedobacter luteus TaxID=623280 RepID=A0A1T4ZS35_9SPHI|nr:MULTISPECIES: helix-turn-helix transcriptional regulator [Parapedobacter]MBK1438554.1 helix-turn-helix transcriptional regulator [Parapedobacter sp. ISTM3]SKB25562.1 Helix-turn-helix [Parapedobacter luteus]